MKRFLASTILFLATSALADQYKDVSDIIFPADESIRFDIIHPCTTNEIIGFLDSLEFPEDSTKPCGKKKIFDQIAIQRSKGGFGNFIRFDFTGDGQEDLISTGQCGGETMETFFWERTSVGYRYHSHYWSEMIKFVRMHVSTGYSLVFRGGLCCDAVIGDYSIYEPTVINDSVYYKETLRLREYMTLSDLQASDSFKVRGYTYTSVLPKSTSTPITFIVAADECELRIEKVVNNIFDSVAAAEGYVPSFGNIMAKFAKGSTGTVYASEKDSTGNEWCYVLFDAENKMTYNDFYHDFPSMKCGWVEAKNISIKN